MKHLPGSIEAHSDLDPVDGDPIRVQCLQSAKSQPILSGRRIFKKLFEHQLMVSFERNVRSWKWVGGEAIEHTTGIQTAIDVVT